MLPQRSLTLDESEQVEMTHWNRSEERGELLTGPGRVTTPMKSWDEIPTRSTAYLIALTILIGG